MLRFFLIFSLFVFSCSAATPPNIVFINADDLGWTDLGIQGSSYYESPNLDELARSGVRFTNGYAAAANCAPSRACSISGQWPQRHGIYTVGESTRGKTSDRKLIPISNAQILANEVITLPEVLQRAGYFTAHVGKWHLSEDPCTQGFDINIAGFHGGSPSKGGYFSPYHYPHIANDQPGEYLTDRLATEAVKIINTHSDKPFYLSFTPYTVHTPIQGRKDLVKKFQTKETDKYHNNAKYAAMVYSLDIAVGRIRAALAEQNLLENTLLIFTSDNGGHNGITSNFPLRAGKGSYYEGGIREPFFFSWPGQIETGISNETPITNLDLFPTILAAANITPPTGKILDGQNLLPLLTEKESLPDRNLYWHFPVYLQAYRKNDLETRDPLFRTRPGSVVRSGDWKLHQYFEDNGLELYNLKTDLSEKENLVHSHPEKAKELLTQLENWRKKTQAPVPTDLNPDFQPK